MNNTHTHNLPPSLPTTPPPPPTPYKNNTQTNNEKIKQQPQSIKYCQIFFFFVQGTQHLLDTNSTTKTSVQLQDDKSPPHHHHLKLPPHLQLVHLVEEGLHVGAHQGVPVQGVLCLGQHLAEAVQVGVVAGPLAQHVRQQALQLHHLLLQVLPLLRQRGQRLAHAALAAWRLAAQLNEALAQELDRLQVLLAGQ